MVEAVTVFWGTNLNLYQKVIPTGNIIISTRVKINKNLQTCVKSFLYLSLPLSPSLFSFLYSNFLSRFNYYHLSPILYNNSINCILLFLILPYACLSTILNYVLENTSMDMLWFCVHFQQNQSKNNPRIKYRIYKIAIFFWEGYPKAEINRQHNYNRVKW